MRCSKGIRGAMVILAAAAGFLMVPAAVAQVTQARPEVAMVNQLDNWVEWNPLIANEGLVLTVVGPDGRTVTDFERGDTAFFAVLDLQGHQRPDGLYHWELVARSTEEESRRGLSVAGTQSGYFNIVGGRILKPGALVEPLIANLTPGDQSFTGRICFGQDCLDPETWSAAENLRLKQNNNRLTFLDTSGGGFAQGDWQIRANSSTTTADFFALDWLGTSGTGATETPVTTPVLVTGGAPSDSFYMDASGRIGLGTSTPDKRLQIVTANGVNAELHIGGATSATSDVFSGMGVNLDTGPSFNFGYSGFSFGRSSGFFNIRSDASAVAPNPSLRFMTANTQRIIVTNTGFVGIGNSFSAPAERLDVIGNIRASGNFISGSTTLNVPDFVFDPGYKLMPLKELGRFVAEERHLPNMPAAAEMKENGVNLSDLQMRLLEKVEELTLHLVNQDRQLDSLKTENESLKVKLEELGKQLTKKQ